MSGAVFSLSKKMIEEVLAEWEAQHPGADIRWLSGEEFSRRVMEKVKASYRPISPAGKA